MSDPFKKLWQQPRQWQPPRLFEIKNNDDLLRVQHLAENGQVHRFFDAMPTAAEELYDIAYPQEKDLPLAEKSAFQTFKKAYDWPQGVFAYFPWDNTLVRLPGKADLRSLRTSRNRNLITAKEQQKLYNATILVAGLSVGSNIVEALVTMGIGGRFILADMDIIEPSNLNRIKAPYRDVGVHKADSIAMRMSEVDPYLDFVLLRDGLNESNIRQSLDMYQPDIIIDEMDQVKLKIIMRKEAKARRIAVLSAADDGDSTLLDIERYDQNPDYPLLHGLVPQNVLAYLESGLLIPRQQLGLLIGRYFVGPDHIPLRMFQSLEEVGKTLPSWPQLGGAAVQSGIAVAYAARQIILDEPLRQGRFVIGPDQVLDPQLDKTDYRLELKPYQERLERFNLQ